MLGVSDKTLVKMDKVCDYIPFISSLSNIANIIQKFIVIPFLKESSIASSHYYIHLSEKNYLRCAVLLFPGIGNLIVGIYDFFKRDDLSAAILTVLENPENLRYTSKAFRDNDSIMFILVSLNGLALKYASKRLQEDERIVLAAMAQNPDAIQFASSKLRGDGSCMLRIVQKYGRALEYATKKLKSNRCLVSPAVKQAGWLAIRHAAPELQKRYDDRGLRFAQ